MGLFDSNSFDFNLDNVTWGADAASPLSDVSYGSQPMESYTPTGTGSGTFISADWQQGILGGLQTALNYAITRDAYKNGLPINGVAAATQQQVVVQQKQTNGMFLLLCAVGLVLVLK